MSQQRSIRFGASSLSRSGDTIFFHQGEAGIPEQPEEYPAADCSLRVSVLGDDGEEVKWQADLVHADGSERLLTYREAKPGEFPEGIRKWAEELGLPFVPATS